MPLFHAIYQANALITYSIYHVHEQLYKPSLFFVNYF